MCRALGDTRPTLFRHSFDTFPGARNYFSDVVIKYDGSNVGLGEEEDLLLLRSGWGIRSRLVRGGCLDVLRLLVRCSCALWGR
eukprot:5183948-Pyramimonas_sp.AAC.1